MTAYKTGGFLAAFYQCDKLCILGPFHRINL